MITNYYCDESCHKEKDDCNLMFLGTVYCPRTEYNRIKNKLKNIYASFDIPWELEIKSTKVSMGGYDFYRAIVEAFINDPSLKFRCVVADKSHLNHILFNQTHEEWYYKMYYRLIERTNLSENNNIFIDYKDRHSYKNCKRIEEYLNKHFKRNGINVHIQPMDSTESKLMQLTDLFIGLVAYKNKNLWQNEAKINLANLIEQYFKIDFTQTNYNNRFNIFHWQGGIGRV